MSDFPPPPFRLLSTDFDGTIHSAAEHPPIPLRLQHQIARLQSAGVAWVINTGRGMTDLMEGMARARLSVKPDFLITVEREIHRLDGHQYVPHQPWNERCARAHAELFARVRPDVPALFDWVRRHHAATVYEDPWSPFCLIADSNAEADAVCAHMESYCAGIPGLVIVRNDVYARFSHADFDKGTCLGEVARLLGLPAAQILAAGDHFNDLSMLQRARAAHLIAPANAMEAVKAQVLREGGHISTEECGHAVAEGIHRLWPGAE